LHEEHSLQLADAQQTRSTQLPLVHSPALAHACPFARCATQTLPEQK
jgi:hypothetical protein